MGLSAILLVGGFGTRLQPLTLKVPKPMLLVAGVPFIEHQIARAREAGVSEIILATAFLAEVFEPYFGDGSSFGISIKYAVESTPLGTGGAILNASKALTGEGPVVIFNGDVLSGHDLVGQIAFHQSHNADLTLYLTGVPDARPFGAVELDPDLRVIAFNEKMENPPTNIINAGCYIFNREVFDQIPANKVVSVEREIFPKLVSEDYRIYGFVDNSYWLDIGTPAALLKASQDMVIGEIYSSAVPDHESDSMVLPGAMVSPTAALVNGCVIGARAIVESNCVIDGSIIGNGAIIGEGCVLRNCFVAENFEVPAASLAEFSYFGF
ncbi:MAG: NDP-sugar synthase [Actinomycetes bacterium]